MDNWLYTEEIRSHLDRGGRSRYAGRTEGEGRDVARLLSPWRRHRRAGGGPDSVPRHG